MQKGKFQYVAISSPPDSPRSLLKYYLIDLFRSPFRTWKYSATHINARRPLVISTAVYSLLLIHMAQRTGKTYRKNEIVQYSKRQYRIGTVVILVRI